MSRPLQGPRPRSILRPRNTNTTPTTNTRRSAGHSSVRKSHLPKLTDRASRGGGRLGRGSSEDVGPRLSTTTSRITPVRPSASHHLQLPQSGRSSMESARSSGMGSVKRSEVRPITDPAFKNQCIDNILNFLTTNGYNNHFTRRTLVSPTTKDFICIFNFIYGWMSPGFALPSTKYEEEIIKVLRMMSYPIKMSKSSFITVGSPLTWASVLAMLSWLVDAVSLRLYYMEPNIGFPGDVDSDDPDNSKRKFDITIKLFRATSEEEVDQLLEEYKQRGEAARGLQQRDMQEIQHHLEEVEHQLVKEQDEPQQLQKLQQCNKQLMNDHEKYNTYYQDLQKCVEIKKNDCAELEAKIVENKKEAQQLQEEIGKLQRLKKEQALSAVDLAKFKNHANIVETSTKQLQDQIKDADSQIWNLEMDLSKAQKPLSELQCEASQLQCRQQLQYPVDFEAALANAAENLEGWQLMTEALQQHKKAAKTATVQMQSAMRKEEEVNSMIKQKLQEAKSNVAKLEAKLKRADEKVIMTEKEIADEEKEMLAVCEREREQIMEAQTSGISKSSLYQKQRELEEAKADLEKVRKHARTATGKGVEFLVTACQKVLDHSKAMKKKVKEHHTTVHKELKELADLVPPECFKKE